MFTIHPMNYSDISSYPEQAFYQYWKQVLSDPHFLKLLAKVTRASLQYNPVQEMKRIYKPGGVSRLVTRSNQTFWSVLRKLKGVHSWLEFQRFMIFFLDQIIERTTEGFSIGGLDNVRSIPQDKGICFLSSHRATFLDPALANYALFQAFGRIAHNAAGDNIFRTPWLGHLIRLNKGFMVKREVEDMDEKLLEAQKLSTYIQDQLNKADWVWIAHRNGRAKDGNDLTDSAVLSMLKLANAESDWEEYSTQQALCPVAMSWELIPLDNLMAQELNGLVAHTGKHRDMMNIISEIRIPKKRVHIQYCPPARGAKRTTLVKDIDGLLHLNTKVWEGNWVAYLAVLEENDPQGAREIRETLSTKVDLSKGQWILARIQEQQTEVLGQLESGELFLPESNGDAAPSQSAGKFLDIARSVGRSLLTMYAATAEAAIRAGGSVQKVLEHQEKFIH